MNFDILKYAGFLGGELNRALWQGALKPRDIAYLNELQAAMIMVHEAGIEKLDRGTQIPRPLSKIIDELAIYVVANGPHGQSIFLPSNFPQQNPAAAIADIIKARAEAIGRGAVPQSVPAWGNLLADKQAYEDKVAPISANLKEIGFALQYAGRLAALLRGDVAGLNRPEGELTLFSAPHPNALKFAAAEIKPAMERVGTLLERLPADVRERKPPTLSRQERRAFLAAIKDDREAIKAEMKAVLEWVRQTAISLTPEERQGLGIAPDEQGFISVARYLEPSLRAFEKAHLKPNRFAIARQFLQKIAESRAVNNALNVLPLVYTGINIAALLTAKFLCAVPLAVGAATLITHSLPFALIGLLVAGLGIFKAAHILANAKTQVNEQVPEGAEPAKKWLGSDSKISRFYRANKQNLHKIGGLLLFLTSASTAAFASLNLAGALGAAPWLPQSCPSAPDAGTQLGNTSADAANINPNPAPPEIPPPEIPPIESGGTEGGGAPANPNPAIQQGAAAPQMGLDLAAPINGTEAAGSAPAGNFVYPNGITLQEVAAAREAIETYSTAINPEFQSVLPEGTQTFLGVSGDGTPLIVIATTEGDLIVPAATSGPEDVAPYLGALQAGRPPATWLPDLTRMGGYFIPKVG